MHSESTVIAGLQDEATGSLETEQTSGGGLRTAPKQTAAERYQHVPGVWTEPKSTIINISPQVNVTLSGATFLQNERDMQKLGEQLTPYITKEIARDVDLMDRYGLDTKK